MFGAANKNIKIQKHLEYAHLLPSIFLSLSLTFYTHTHIYTHTRARMSYLNANGSLSTQESIRLRTDRCKTFRRTSGVFAPTLFGPTRRSF